MTPVSLPSLDDLGLASLRSHRVLVRVDFNVPLDGDTVTDDTRLTAALPTIEALRGAGARVILMSHLGRPKGERKPELSLRPVAARLSELMSAPVAFAADCIGEPATTAVDALGDGELLVLENLRFHVGEKKNHDDFASALAAHADVYVNDAFGAAHRAHASVVGVPARVARSAAGRLLTREVEVLGQLLAAPATPFAAILGGAKISDKIDVIENLIERLDVLIVGGGMANTFLRVHGHDLQRSLVEEDKVDEAKRILDRAAALGARVELPVDLVVTDDLGAPQRIETVAPDAIPEGMLAVDVGPESRARFLAALGGVKTLFWNGPLGVFEKEPFDAGTDALASGLETVDGFVVIGGGETVAAVGRAGMTASVDHVSTGGGASLELLGGKTLPGVAALVEKGGEA
ncbi:MAG: phosphoglycerate kinase [Acidobacteriota bacterium]